MAKSNSNTKLEFSVVASIVAVTLISGVVLSSIRVNADTNAVDEVNITVPSACTMSGNIATGQEHTASINPNTYQDNIGKTTITAFCNDSGGYAIYAIGFTGNKYEGEDHTKLIGTNTDQKIITGTAKTGTSQWAMRVTPVTGTYTPTIENDFDSADYHVVPNTYTKVATYGNTTDAEGGTGSSIETTYAAYISGTQPADTYTGKVKYTLVHPATEIPNQPHATEPGYIAYYPNANDVVGVMGKQSISDTATSATLIASNFSREGYGFAGWNDKFDYTGNFYGPNEDITFTAGQYSGANKGLSLYAVWVKSVGALQDSDTVTSVCNSLTTASPAGGNSLASVSALTDQRDNNTYTIAKLADNNCWMIENLRLENTAEHNTDGSLAQGYGTSTSYGSFVGLADPETNIGNITTPNSLYSTDGSNGTENVGTGSYYGFLPNFRIPRYRNDNTQTRQDGIASTNPNGNIFSYGNYYNWPASVADTSPHTSNYTSVTTSSICPKGWRLPLGGNEYMSDNNDFWILSIAVMGAAPSNNRNYQNSEKNSVGDTAPQALRKYPNNFLYSGSIINGSSITNRGTNGTYRTSTTLSDGTSSYNLYLYPSLLYPGTEMRAKYEGASVRCLTES